MIARPDVWLQMIAVLLFLVAVILVVSSLDFAGKAEKEGFHFVLDSTILLTVAALILYAVLLPAAGFIPTTFLMTVFLTAVYTLKEEKLCVRGLDKKDMIRIGRKSVITGAVLLVILWLVFAKLLAIQLP
ncbi:tripartite tricarboxylate transporter TctB family protein [Clostridium sp. AM58-1XD]|uniref:tripartite tricarboxylate transporter TctB family protein n=1 Tax=Clostridium sp. AM58-1XD TaxID=2292307 RepID=UPI00325ADF47